MIGSFARARLPEMEADALDEFEALLELPDQDLYAWIVGRDAAPDGVDGPVFRALSESAHAVALK